MLFSTIISPETDGIIESGSIDYLVCSIDKHHRDYYLDVKYRNVEPLSIKVLATKAKNTSFNRISNKDYIVGKNRDYFKMTNFIELFKKSKTGMLCFLDADMVVAKAIELEPDFDIAFTVKGIGQSEIHIVNLGICFINKTKENSNRVTDFLVNMVSSTRSLDLTNPDSVNFWKYMGIPEIKAHLEFLDDYIVSQDFINSICYTKNWYGPGVYDFNGLKFKLLDSRYNKTWYFNQKIDPNVFIYHFKGRRENKVERAKKLMEIL